MKIKNALKGLCLTLITGLTLSACQSPITRNKDNMIKLENVSIINDKYRTAYEVFVYSFYDGNGDGIGDLKGLTEKLDYINDGNPASSTSLLANEIWLMPISPASSYHKYDVEDYKEIDPEYGTLSDFKKLVEESHKRGINIIIDLVMNHSSSKHPWFVKASEYMKTLKKGEKPDFNKNPYANYYNFSTKKEEGYEPLPGSDWFYEARFWSEMPDFNLDNPKVREEFRDIFQFWLDLGVDGFRLDAVTSYYTGRKSKNTEVLKWLNDTVKEIKADAYIVGEAWTTTAEYGAYYESGVDSFFDFEFSGSDGVIAKILKGVLPASKYAETQVISEELFSSKNKDYINAPFYTNHDIPRSAGYYSGEQRIPQIKLAGAMNLLMNGHAFLYYGEEIGMKGAGKDENKRAPMQWNTDRNAKGMCFGPKNMEEVKMIYGTLEEQEKDSSSIYHYYKNAIRLRHKYPVIARGYTDVEESLNTETLGLSAFYRLMKDESLEPVLIIINPTAEKKEVALSSDINFRVLKDSLLTGDEEVKLSGDKLSLPPFSTAILGK